MNDPIDDMIRSASVPETQPRPTPRPRTRTALALLLGIAAALIGLPIFLALTGDTTDALLGLAIGDPSLITGGGQ